MLYILTALPLFKLVYYRVSQSDLSIPVTPAQKIHFPTLAYITLGASLCDLIVVSKKYIDSIEIYFSITP